VEDVESIGSFKAVTNLQSFSQKVIVITGASSGIGQELALALSSVACDLVLIGRDAQRLEQMLARTSNNCARVMTIAADMSDGPQCEAAIEQAVSAFGSIDHLFCNAGMAMKGFFGDADHPHAAVKVMENNYNSVVYSCFYSLPHLTRAKGHITVTGGLVGHVGLPGYAAYAASKHAVRGFVHAIRNELAGRQVGITLVNPDIVRTSIRKNMLDASGRPMPLDYTEKNLMSARECADKTLRSTLQKRSEVFLTLRCKLLILLQIFSPGTLDKILRKSIGGARA
jgi:NADP-dependent 3-hydroxy acid dehydrogenase YdfG